MIQNLERCQQKALDKREPTFSGSTLDPSDHEASAREARLPRLSPGTSIQKFWT